MEQNNNNNNKLPPLSAKYPWFVVQNLEDLTHQYFSTLHDPLLSCHSYLKFLTGTSKELFYIMVGLRYKTPADVYLFKLDMTSINWKDLECLKNWDMSGVEKLHDIVGDYVTQKKELIDYLDDLEVTEDLWEEVQELSDSIFVVDIARDNSEFYNPAIALELGGYIHIHDKMDKVREANFIVDSKQEEDELVVALTTDNVVEASESRLLDIPLDVLEMIMKLCVGVEYMNFRATCTRCLLAAPLIQWRNQTALHNYSLVSPWLMVVDQIRGIITFADPIMCARYFMRCPQLSIYDESICCSRFGWLLFKNIDSCPTFFNPFTNDLRELPDQHYCIYKLWFSAPPTSSECMVVIFSTENISILNVAQEQTWRVFELDTNDLILSPVMFPTFHSGDLYTLYSKGQLRVFKDLGEADISQKHIKAEVPRSCSRSPARYFLVKCDQHLLLVVMVSVGEPIEVFKLTDSTEWEKVNGVGKHSIYICDTMCLCIKAKTLPEMENKIYLAQSANKKIVFYSLETCTYYTFNGKSIQESLGDFVTTTYLSAHTWIETSWSP